MTLTIAAVGSGRQLLVLAVLGWSLPLQGQQWQQAIPGKPIPQLVHDIGRNRTFLIPGAAETWDLIGDRWRQASTTISPTFPGPCAYDLFRSRFLMLLAPVIGTVATWQFDGSTWRQLVTSGSPPTSCCGFVHDVARDRFVFFGGPDRLGANNETWEFDGSTWTQRNLQTSPPARRQAAITYDLSRAVTVLFGGTSSPATSTAITVLADTWQYDGQTWSHVQVATAPSGRANAAATYDMASARVVLFGGNAGQNQYLGDTWSFDGTSWTQQAPAAAPTARAYAPMTYDWAARRCLLYGGFNDTDGGLSDTWQYTGGAWTQLRSSSPRPRTGAAMVYDAAHNRAVLFGGEPGAGNDTMTWNGVDWTRLQAPNGPSNRHQHGMAYDSRRRRTLLFGGDDISLPADTWSFDGATWTQLTGVGVPTPSHGVMMAYDDDRDRVVLFGGYDWSGDRAETWEFDGVRWLQRITAHSPPARESGAMVYDLARGRMVLFGGSGSSTGVLGDTWEYDGVDWTALQPATSPTARTLLQMTYDRHRGRTVLFGGSGSPADLWEYDGTAWTQIATTSAPLGTSEGAMAYDARRQCHVLHSGTSWWRYSETWELLPPATATFARCGRGCPGSAGVPTLDSVGGAVPTLGTTFPLALGNLPAAPGFAFLGVGFDVVMHQGAPLPQPLDAQGLPGCLLWVSPTFDLLVAHGGGTATVNVPVPNNVALRNLEVGVQALTLDAGAAGGLGAVSNGALLVLR